MYDSSVIYDNSISFPMPLESEEIRRLKHSVEKLEHDLFYLFLFLASESTYEEACDYLEEHEDNPLPFKLH